MSELFLAYRASWETDAHRDLRKHAAEFLRKESTPNQERWSAQHQVDREFWNKMGDAGLLGLTFRRNTVVPAVISDSRRWWAKNWRSRRTPRPDGPCTRRSSRTTSTPTAMRSSVPAGCRVSSVAIWSSPSR